MNSICGCRYNCTLFSIVTSLVLGILAAFLTITAVLTIPTAFLWVLLGVSLGYLAISLITSVFISNCSQCVSRNLGVLLGGALLTVLASAILLTVDVAAASVIGAILVGVLIFGFSLTLTSGACLAKCLACSEE